MVIPKYASRMDLLAGTKVATSGLLVYAKCVTAESFGPIQEAPAPHPMSSSLIAKLTGISIMRSEERRVGKECRSRRSQFQNLYKQLTIMSKIHAIDEDK